MALEGRRLRRTRPIDLEQQDSVASANAIWKRLEEGLGTVEPERVIARDTYQLKAFGLSAPKARSIHGVAEPHINSEVDPNELTLLSDDEAREKLIMFNGIGRWTAEAYLMGCEARRDNRRRSTENNYEIRL